MIDPLGVALILWLWTIILATAPRKRRTHRREFRG
jgi:hypothetical protein